MTGLAWHVVQCIGRSDEQALAWLRRRDVEYYYPMMRVMRRVARNKLSRKQRLSGLRPHRPVFMPLFPRYAFVRMDMGHVGWRDVLDFAGIGGLVCANDLPVQVPDSLICELREREVDGAVPGRTPATQVFRVGETVRITSGPFAEFRAVVERLPRQAIEDIDPDTRIRVALNLFGGATPVDLNVAQVAKVS